MRLARLHYDETTRIAQQIGDQWHCSTSPETTLTDVILDSHMSFDGDRLPKAKARFATPWTPRTIFGIGLNYSDTVAEMGWETPNAPYLFPKLTSSVNGPYNDIVVDHAITTRVDWETELGVIIGHGGRNIPATTAMDHVFGYTIANDISSRDLQASDGQWVRGKGLDTYCPLGPVIVTADEIDDPQNLRIQTKINGALMQDGTTANMIFSIAHLVEYCSRFFTLAPGDLILTGTPAGCGDFRTPPIALTPGDVVEARVQHLGYQRNHIVAPS